MQEVRMDGSLGDITPLKHATELKQVIEALNQDQIQALLVGELSPDGKFEPQVKVTRITTRAQRKARKRRKAAHASHLKNRGRG